MITNYTTSAPSWISAKSLRVAATFSQKQSYTLIVDILIPSLKRLLAPYNKPATGTFYQSMMNAIKAISTASRKMYMETLFVDGATGSRLTKVHSDLTINGVTIPRDCSNRGRIPKRIVKKLNLNFILIFSFKFSILKCFDNT